MPIREHLRHLRTLSASRSAVVVCVLLVALLAVMQVPHLHSSPAAADRCALCVVMHTAAPAASTAAVVILIQLGIAIVSAKPQSITRYWHPQLFTRPPPTLL